MDHYGLHPNKGYNSNLKVKFNLTIFVTIVSGCESKANDVHDGFSYFLVSFRNKNRFIKTVK